MTVFLKAEVNKVKNEADAHIAEYRILIEKLNGFMDQLHSGVEIPQKDWPNGVLSALSRTNSALKELFVLHKYLS